MMAYKNNFFKSALSYEGKIFASYKYQLEIQNKLLQVIKSNLPGRLSSHALYSVISGQNVLLYTDSAVWSSQLRFYHKSILQGISASNCGVFDTLQIKVIPTSAEHQEKKTKKLPSADNIDLILSQAENQNDETLKTALLKLGKTFQKNLKNKAETKDPSEK